MNCLGASLIFWLQAWAVVVSKESVNIISMQYIAMKDLTLHVVSSLLQMINLEPYCDKFLDNTLGVI